MTVYTYAEALLKLQRYCVYQDRCHQEVEQKLRDLGVSSDIADAVIVALINDNFLNEQRFACSFARGKFRVKRWGKDKIRRELRKKNISPYCLEKAMDEIEEEEYYQVLSNVLEKKNATLRESDSYKRKTKLARFAIQRGYEPPLFWPLINELVDDNGES